MVIFTALLLFFYLWGKIVNVGLLLLQGSLRDKHGEIAVLHSQLPNLSIKEVFDGFPNGEGPGPQHIAAADVIILNHLCFSDDLEERELRPGQGHFSSRWIQVRLKGAI